MTSKIIVNTIEGDVGVSSVTVASNLNVPGSITVGNLIGNVTGEVNITNKTTLQRNAGVGTDDGALVYNSDVKQLQVYNGSIGWSNLGGGYIEASGGTVSEYQDGNVFYRAHKFTNSGQFNVHNAPENAKIDYLLVGGGGSGGTGGVNGRSGAGGGAGLLRYQTNQSISEGSYNITIGAGGVGSISNVIGNPGNASTLELGSTTVTSPGGGGGAGGSGGINQRGADGGSGGGGQNERGGSSHGDAGGSNGSVSPDQGWGNNGEGPINAGGGGGAGQSGGTGRDRDGGDGLSYNITGITTYYAGGGGGADSEASLTGPYVEPLAGVGGLGGGGDAHSTYPTRTGEAGGAQHGVGGSGGGGGGAARFDPAPVGLQIGANGGSGVCVIRYQIGGLSGTAKATGGMISFKGGKVIHQFLSSGEFTVTNPTLTSINYLVVGGGGGGGGDNNNNGGGGGAGLLRYAENQPISTGTYPVVVGASGAGGQNGTGNNSGQGFNGGASTLNLPSAITSPGGGGGGGQAPSVGREGGSGGGGGGGGAAASPGNGTGVSGGTPNSVSPPLGWGNNGGQNNGNEPYCAGGGGGAGANGYDGGNANSFPTTMNPLGRLGRGGTGLIYNITGYDVGYAGGGSAALSERGPDIGGGGRGPGSYDTPGSGTAGQINRGSGGGGGCRVPGSGPDPNIAGSGGNGGSGIVIISYPV